MLLLPKLLLSRFLAGQVLGSWDYRPRFLPQPIRFGLSAFVIARPTDEEAQAELERLMALQKLEEQYKLSVAKCDLN
ncbi:MAG: hypothetical protein V7L22_15765 [Nostoc sp.]|uniref:hypothetical protein n=1 Tax=Nostoc sp. TaxID=1180 RepID=UPI002FF4FE76